MIYPQFLAKGDTIGICAPSAGVDREDACFARSLHCLQSEGYRIRTTDSVYSALAESAPPSVRGAEWNELVKDPSVRMILCATGGDFLIGMLPYVDYEAFAASPKWVQGYSDPTGLLYSITTKWDVATIYGVNAGGFWTEPLDPSLADGLKILRGEIPCQHSFALYESSREGRDSGYALSTPVRWQTPFSDRVKETGRMLGGCLDCLYDLIGTRFDGTLDFIRRYEKDGVLWYFDVFAMKAESVYNTLFRMKDMGLFRTARAFIFGRVCYPGSFGDFSYAEAAQKAIGDVPMIFDADIGHVPPKMTVINGAMGEIQCQDGQGTLRMTLI